jgi:FkbM family methyltransferase
VIDLSAVGNDTVIGRALRAPLRLIPRGMVLPVLQGPLRGARWVVGSGVHGCWLGCYETAKQATCIASVRRGATAYDLGANVGFYTLLFSRLVGRNGAVHAFEPADRNLAFLRRHVIINYASNVHVHGAAVGRQTGTALFDPASHPSMGRLVPVPGSQTMSVPLVALDDFVYACGNAPPNIVKMDVEGGEVDVLLGMRRLLAEKRPMLLVAIHGEDQWSGCHRLLVEARYSIRDLGGRPVDKAVVPDEIVALPER